MSLWDWLFRRRQRDQQLEEEVQAHLRMAAPEHSEQGESPEQARASAIREFGNVSLVKEITRDMWGFRWLDELLQDLRYGARQFRKNPGFTAIAIMTLALGIGANTAVFSVAYAVLFKPLPYHDPARLLRVYSANARSGGDHWMSSPADIDFVRRKRLRFPGDCILSGRGRGSDRRW